MSSRFVIGFLAFIALAILVLFFIFAPSAARFIVVNSDSDPVRVSAHWRDQTKDLGLIAPGQRAEFSIKDEAGISFDITRQNGSGAHTGEIYFTSGTITKVEIAHTRVDVKSEVGAYTNNQPIPPALREHSDF